MIVCADRRDQGIGTALMSWRDRVPPAGAIGRCGAASGAGGESVTWSEVTS
jgi:hypothetical protein